MVLRRASIPKRARVDTEKSRRSAARRAGAVHVGDRRGYTGRRLSQRGVGRRRARAGAGRQAARDAAARAAARCLAWGAGGLYSPRERFRCLDNVSPPERLTDTHVVCRAREGEGHWGGR
jgi:hypothetical protein